MRKVLEVFFGVFLVLAVLSFCSLIVVAIMSDLGTGYNIKFLITICTISLIVSLLLMGFFGLILCLN